MTVSTDTFICRICNSEKNSSDFIYGQNKCRTCHNKRQKENRLRRNCGLGPQTAVREKNRQLIAEGREREIWQDRHLRGRYGITLDDWRKMYADQDGKCGICDLEFEIFDRKDIHVDHDEKTGQIRGLLCSQCNMGIGKLFHSIENLKGAIVYLERFQ